MDMILKNMIKKSFPSSRDVLKAIYTEVREDGFVHVLVDQKF